RSARHPADCDQRATERQEGALRRKTSLEFKPRALGLEEPSGFVTHHGGQPTVGRLAGAPRSNLPWKLRKPEQRVESSHAVNDESGSLELSTELSGLVPMEHRDGIIGDARE